jgi:hypothetical protein
MSTEAELRATIEGFGVKVGGWCGCGLKGVVGEVGGVGGVLGFLLVVATTGLCSYMANGSSPSFMLEVVDACVLCGAWSRSGPRA